MFSILPWPYGCSESGGLSDILTEKKAIIEANRSIPECMASDNILTDPLMRPATVFIIMRQEFEITDNLAVLIFSFMNRGSNIFYIVEIFTIGFLGEEYRCQS